MSILNVGQSQSEILSCIFLILYTVIYVFTSTVNEMKLQAVVQCFPLVHTMSSWMKGEARRGPVCVCALFFLGGGGGVQPLLESFYVYLE